MRATYSATVSVQKTVVRERNIASQIWLETLPITWRRILHSSSILSERRLVLESETVAGILPLTLPKKLDNQGVEFLTNRGGKPVCVDLFTHTQHALITGKTGSGKSVLLWRFMLDALSQGIPVVGMDIPAADGESSFKTAIELLGDARAPVRFIPRFQGFIHNGCCCKSCVFEGSAFPS